ncbi:uncharacterized protein LOC101849653 [Aplysia californica]|uniref:Uncharacterized protein LOC101849653 n=1 Tax=Aplysia californica TaxID=6500 RepID=A0ABM1ABA2_APLCA|nr:uncharacterized protein LOC101849653 [Aplysia californica]
MSSSKEYVQHFNQLTLQLLSDKERGELHKGLRNYQRTSDLPRLARTVRRLLDTPEKQKLLAYIRAPMSSLEKCHFDRLFGESGPNSVVMSTISSSRPGFLGPITTPPGSTSALERPVTIHGSRGGSMGFSIRGGSEFGLGIYVSMVKPGSPADIADLKVGDHILLANGVDFNCVANSGAVKVLSSSALLNLVVVRTGKVPEWKVARERVLWYDVASCRVVATPPASETSSTSSAPHVLVERKVVINVSQDSDFIGLNIRGGREYGVGIYVSRVDAGGLASKVGLSAGDQIINSNGVDFTSINHTDAVDELRSSTHLIITIRSLGKYPVYKELCAEYTWSDGTSHTTRQLDAIGGGPPSTFSGGSIARRHTQRTRARESSIDLTPFAHTSHNNNNNGNTNQGYVSADDDNIEEIEELDDGLEVQRTAICYPGDKDIMYRRSYEDSWKELDNITDADDHHTETQMANSWSVDNKDSLGHFRHGSDHSEHAVDYTTFLQQSALREQQRQEIQQQQQQQHQQQQQQHQQQQQQHQQQQHQQQQLRSSIISHGYIESVNNNEPVIETFIEDGEDIPVIETVIEEAVTDFSASSPVFTTTSSAGRSPTPSRSSSQSRENGTSEHVYSEVAVTSVQRTRTNSHSGESSPTAAIQPIYATVNKKRGSTGSVRSVGSGKTRRAPEAPSGAKVVVSNGVTENNLDEISTELRRLQTRQSTLGFREISRVAGSDTSSSSQASSEKGDDSFDKGSKSGTWTSLKNKLKGSLRIKGSNKNRSSIPSADAYARSNSNSSNNSTPSGSLRQKGVFERSFGSQLLNAHSSDRYNLMGVLEDHARRTLKDDECTAVLRHVHNYHENKDLNRLVELLLIILDKSDKRLLLVDVRGVIAPSHVEKFDNLVAHCNLQGYDNAFKRISAQEQFKVRTAEKPERSTKPQPMRARNGELPVGTKGNNHGFYEVNPEEPSFQTFSAEDFKRRPSHLEVVILEKQGNTRGIPKNLDGCELVYISKHKNYLGLQIKGGRNNTEDQAIRIHTVVKGGAASDDRALQPGKEITHVDGKSLLGLSCDEAESILQLSFSIKTPVNMELRLRRS